MTYKEFEEAMKGMGFESLVTCRGAFLADKKSIMARRDGRLYECVLSETESYGAAFWHFKGIVDKDVSNGKEALA